MVEAIQSHYMRAAIYKLSQEYGCKMRYTKLTDYFQVCKENINIDRLNVLAVRLVAAFKRKWPGGTTTRDKFLQSFSLKNWRKLPTAERAKHTFGKCERCSYFTAWHNVFPSKSPRQQRLLKAARQEAYKVHETATTADATASLHLLDDV